MAGFRIPDLPVLTPAELVPDDKLVIFDTSSDTTKAVDAGSTLAGVLAPIGPPGYIFTSNGTGAEWRTSGALSVTAQRKEIIATEGQTNFATTAPYVVDYLGVYLNGVRLASNDFTAIDGHNVVLTAPAKANDVVLLEGFLGSDTGSGDDFLRADLIETSGAGLVGFDPALVYPPFTVGNAMATGFVKKPGDTMTGKLTVKTVGALIALESTAPRGAGSVVMEFNDPSGRKGYVGYGSVADDSLTLSNDMNSPIIFRTNAVEAMRVTEIGRVGIGTTAPGGKLGITDNSAPQLRIDTTVPRGSGTCAINFGDPIGVKGVLGYYAGSDLLILNNVLNQPLTFGTNDTERMRIDATGHVGINTNNPQDQLDVYGGISMGAQLTMGRGTSTGPVAIELGQFRTGDGVAFIDFHASAGSDFDARIQRAAGVAGIFTISNNGDGNLTFRTGTQNANIDISAGPTFSVDGAAIALRGKTASYNPHGLELYAGGFQRATLDKNGSFGIGVVPKGSGSLQVGGDVYMSQGGTFTGNAYLVGGNWHTFNAGYSFAISMDQNAGNFAIFNTAASVAADAITSLAQRVTLSPAGRVGINCYPNEMLDVNGNISVHNGQAVYCAYDGSNNWNGQQNAGIQFSASQIVFYTGNVQRAFFRSDGFFYTQRPTCVKQDTSNGGLLLSTGDSTHTGYIRFWGNNELSYGYIGYNTQTSGAHINYVNENPTTAGGHNFGNQPMWAGSYNPGSDRRMKDNIRSATLDVGPIIDAIEIVQYDWHETGKHHSVGIIAQDLYKILPEAVTPADENLDMWSYDLGKMVMLLLAETKAMRARLAALEARP